MGQKAEHRFSSVSHSHVRFYWAQMWRKIGVTRVQCRHSAEGMQRQTHTSKEEIFKWNFPCWATIFSRSRHFDSICDLSIVQFHRDNDLSCAAAWLRCTHPQWFRNHMYLVKKKMMRQRQKLENRIDSDECRHYSGYVQCACKTRSCKNWKAKQRTEWVNEWEKYASQPICGRLWREQQHQPLTECVCCCSDWFHIIARAVSVVQSTRRNCAFKWMKSKCRCVRTSIAFTTISKMVVLTSHWKELNRGW